MLPMPPALPLIPLPAPGSIWPGFAMWHVPPALQSPVVETNMLTPGTLAEPDVAGDEL